MDVTVLFKACVKTVKTRNKALGLGPAANIDLEKKNKHKTKTEFYIKAKELVNCISKLQEFLLDHRKNYINTNNLISDSSSMSDVQRDQIDSEAQNIIRQCSHNIREFHAQGFVQNEQGNSQLLQHKDAVVSLLSDYLKKICKIYTEQRAIRIKKIIDLQKMSKLETKEKHITKSPTESTIHSELQFPHSQSKSQLNLDTDDKPSDTSHFKDEDILSPEEIQMFEQENEKLFEEFTSLTADIRQIEGKVVEISKLQEVFADKVLEQGKDIELMADNVMGTTETIRDANEELREAMKKNATFRVWILFVLLVLSFSLLFLDWYNP
uniref:Syntaxin-18 n=1 Tax=Strigamia maritima TaxID=126957 RepID=T1IIR1_STRMM